MRIRGGIPLRRCSPFHSGGLKEEWTFTTTGGVVGPALVDGIVYFGAGDGNAYAVHASTGALVWKTFVGDGGTTPLTVANGWSSWGRESITATSMP